MQTHVEIIVIGQVQGVGYRNGTKQKARELGLHGWVKNENDGSVHISVEGDSTAVDRLIAWCHEGTFLARVERVTVTPGPIEYLSGFEVKR